MSRERHYEFSSKAERDFRQLDVDTRRRVVEALDGLVAEPPHGDVKKLRGTQDEWRLRVGDWQVRFRWDADGGVVRVLSVQRRDRAYR